MDTQRLNALLVARGLLDRGRTAVDGTGPGAMASVVLFDLAVETAAKAMRAAHPAFGHSGEDYLEKTGELAKPVRGDLKFPRMLDDLLAALREKEGDESLILPGRDNVLWLHKYRNGVQHDANEPSHRDIERCNVYATDFVSDLLRAFYDIPLEEVSRASLVEDEAVRDKIREAETRAGVDDFTAAMEQLAVAFELARFVFRSEEPYRRALRVSRSDIGRALSDLVSPGKTSSSVAGKLRRALEQIPGKKLSSFDIKDIVEGVIPSKARGDSRRFERLLREVVGSVERVEERFEAVTVAGDPSEYAWFRRRVPKPVAYAGDGSELAWQTIPPDPPADQREYLRALEFVTTTALRWQQFPRPEMPDVEEEAEDAVEDLNDASSLAGNH